MRARVGRQRLTRTLVGAAAVAALLALPRAASADPIDVFFDGPTLMDEAGDPSNFGMSIEQVMLLGDAIEVRDDLIVGGLGDVAVVDQALESFDPDPTKPSGNRASSRWKLENTGSGDLLGDQFLLFTHSDSFVKAGVLIDYADELIGITIDPDDGWLIVKARDEVLGDFYYPAKQLVDGVFEAGSDVSLLVSYVTNAPLLEAPPGSEKYQLPELQVGWAVVPEPGSAALVATGLFGLALRRRRG